MLDKMKEFTSKMCVCADRSSADCAKKVTDEMQKWAMAMASDPDTSERPTEEMTKVTQRLTECATKAMMAGMQTTPSP
jgi:hypothetical protein